jgi:hypothetical protein
MDAPAPITQQPISLLAITAVISIPAAGVIFHS